MKLCLLATALLIAGCAKNSLPTYPSVDAQQTRIMIQERSDAVKTVDASATIILTKPDGDSVSLDGVMLLQKPDRLRIRAWKFGQAVFDITLTPDAVWQYVPRDEAKGSMRVTRSVAEKLRDILGGSVPVDGVTSLSAAGVLIKGSSGSGMIEQREYDRTTLTLRSLKTRSPDGRIMYALTLSEYKLIDGLVWPTRVDATSEYGLVSIRFSEVEINTELTPAAFKHPSRAERVP